MSVFSQRHLSNLVQMKELLKRQRQSSKLTNEQIQRKLMENGLFKDDLSKNAPVRNPPFPLFNNGLFLDLISTKTNVIFSGYNS